MKKGCLGYLVREPFSGLFQTSQVEVKGAQGSSTELAFNQGEDAADRGLGVGHLLGVKKGLLRIAPVDGLKGWEKFHPCHLAGCGCPDPGCDEIPCLLQIAF